MLNIVQGAVIDASGSAADVSNLWTILARRRRGHDELLCFANARTLDDMTVQSVS